MKLVNQNTYFTVDGLPIQKGTVGLLLKGKDSVGLYEIGSRRVVVAPEPYTDWTDAADQPFASLQDLITSLTNAIFKTGAGGIVPSDHQVDTYSDLPDAIIHNGEYWLVEQVQGSNWLFNRKDPGIYKAVAGTWSYRGPDVPAYFRDDQLLFKDDAGPGEMIYTLDALTARRNIIWQDKDGSPQYFDDLTKYEGQVKINDGNGVKPTIQFGGAGIPVNTFGQLTYTLPLGLSSAPTTQWPENIAAPTDADIYDNVNDTIIENTILGQVNAWRLIFNFSGKGNSAQTGIIVRLENTLSGFIEDNLFHISNERTEGQFAVRFYTIADQASLPSPFGTGQGYELSISADDPITIELDSLTRINLAKHER